MGKLTLKNIHKSFITKNGDLKVLDDINIEIEKGEIVCVIGPSGCGKSTLLNIIAGLEKPTGGSVNLKGKEVKFPGPDRVVMFQEAALFPWLKVIKNVEFGLKMAKVSKHEGRETALKYLKMVHLTKFQNSYVHELSGGMKQRVALARALAMNSDVLLMDEPFAALDSQTKYLLQAELERIWLETKKTIFFITHNVEEALMLADKIVILSTNPGRVKKEFKISIDRPRKTDNIEILRLTKEIMLELKEEVNKVAQAESDDLQDN